MTTAETIRGVLKPDGTLELQDKPALPPGPVRVTLEVEPVSNQHDAWATLERIWNERKARGLQPRSGEAIDAEISTMRDEWEQRQADLDRSRTGAGENHADRNNSDFQGRIPTSLGCLQAAKPQAKIGP